MTRDQITSLQCRLREAIDDSRANSKLKAAEYSLPVSGLIFHGHAHSIFLSGKAVIEKPLPVDLIRGVRSIWKNDFLAAIEIFKKASLLYLTAE